LEEWQVDDVTINISGYELLVSARDLEKVMSKKWHKSLGRLGIPYFACHKPVSGKIYLHRFIMNCPSDMVVDHISGNTLDNRRENLRICTQAENNRNLPKPKTNTSGYKGVYWNKEVQKWQSYIQINKKKKRLGSFKTPEEAYQAYCEASQKCHGEFGRFE
jgi:hypothetical protein